MSKLYNEYGPNVEEIINTCLGEKPLVGDTGYSLKAVSKESKEIVEAYKKGIDKSGYKHTRIEYNDTRIHLTEDEDNNIIELVSYRYDGYRIFFSCEDMNNIYAFAGPDDTIETIPIKEDPITSVIKYSKERFKVRERK